MKRLLALLLTGLLVLISIGGCAKGEQKTISAFVGSASQPAMEEAARAFEDKTGIKVSGNYGGSGTMLSQLKMARRGDLYIPGSPDYMEKAKRDGVIDPDSVKIIAYLVPAILVRKGNPQGLRGLSDLARPGIKVGIGDPETVCVGLYAYEILGRAGLLEAVQKNRTVVTYAESCEKTAALLALKKVDAVLGWDVFSQWHPDTLERVDLRPEEISRIAYVPGAVTAFSQNKAGAQKFLDFLASPQGRGIFSRWGYLVTEAEARKSAPQAGIGGEYKLPADYKPLVAH